METNTNITPAPVAEPAIRNVDNYRAYLRQAIQAKSKRRLRMGVFIVAIAAALLVYENNFIANFISGPRPISASALEGQLASGKIKDINLSVQVDPGNAFRTGYTYVTKASEESSTETTQDEYYLTIVGSHLLTLEGVPGQVPSGKFVGAVTPIRSDLKEKLLADFKKDPDLQDLDSSVLLPYMVSHKGMTGLNVFWAVIGALLFLVFGGIITVRRLLDPEDKKHYLYAMSGQAGFADIDDLSEAFINADKAGSIKLGQSFRLNQKFIFRDGVLFFTVYPLSQMFWAYKKIIQRRVYAVVPAGKSYALVMKFNPNKTLEIAEKESQVAEHLALLATYCPTAKFGYTK